MHSTMLTEKERSKHFRYLEVAQLISTWSKDPRTKVGAVVVGEKGQILSQGYNGFPRGFPDQDLYWQDRETKHKYVVHAEQNCIYNASLSGTCLDGGILYVHGLPPCNHCAKGITQVGIKTVVFHEQELKNAKIKGMECVEESLHIFEMCGVKVINLH